MATRNPTEIQKGSVYVVDPSPYNWLFVLFNTMEEPVRTDKAGRVIAALATSAKWINKTTLKMELRKGVTYHNGEEFTANTLKKNFFELQKWAAPHPPGTWLNFPTGTKLSIVDDYTVEFHFPIQDGLAIGKMRGNHLANDHFYQAIGFGYTKLGTGEGHW
ncbi:MAG: ABC transporter substrate-binding protein [Bacillota bacterium]